MSNSKRKMDVVVKQVFGKLWAVVTFKKTGGKWVPSFEDLHRVIQAICYCEDIKYPPPRYKGREFVAEFLVDAAHERDFSTLAKKYKLPIRCGAIVMDSNGARLEDD